MSLNTDGVAVLYQTCLVGWLVFNGTFNIDTLHLAQRVKIMIELQPLHNAIETKNWFLERSSPLTKDLLTAVFPANHVAMVLAY